ncbi:MAG: FtsQ-type POTRA domain-containing protein [Desulfovibrio sp.]|nr:FtsQ-type POTRA domain-containing protein [Desulfovibrio sp.]
MLFILVSIALLVLTALGIGRGFVWLYDTAVTSSWFETKKIEVHGNKRLPRDMILQLANIHEGQNSLAVNIALVEQNLRRTPWVESVSVKRLLPDTFVITLTERMPTFWVQRDGILYYATDEGESIAPVESTNFLSLPALTVEPGADTLRPYLTRFLESVRRGDLPFDMSSMSQVSLSLSKGLEIFLEDRELWLSLDPVDWENSVVKIQRVFTDLLRRREMKNVREMRVIEGNVWVVLNTSVRNVANPD